MWLLNQQPSGVSLRIFARENTWKPPESVRIGPSQPMNRWSPPAPATTSAPGRSMRWYVLPRIIVAPFSRRSRGSSAFTVAWVPTGMNTGVSTAPCAVYSKPARARECASLTWISKVPGCGSVVMCGGK